MLDGARVYFDAPLAPFGRWPSARSSIRLSYPETRRGRRRRRGRARHLRARRVARADLARRSCTPARPCSCCAACGVLGHSPCRPPSCSEPPRVVAAAGRSQEGSIAASRSARTPACASASPRLSGAFAAAARRSASTSSSTRCSASRSSPPSTPRASAPTRAARRRRRRAPHAPLGRDPREDARGDGAHELRRSPEVKARGLPAARRGRRPRRDRVETEPLALEQVGEAWSGSPQATIARSCSCPEPRSPTCASQRPRTRPHAPICRAPPPREHPRETLADDLALEALAFPIHDPRRVHRAVALLHPQHIRMFMRVVQVGETRVILAREQVARHDRLRRLVDDSPTAARSV